MWVFHAKGAEFFVWCFAQGARSIGCGVSCKERGVLGVVVSRKGRGSVWGDVVC